MKQDSQSGSMSLVVLAAITSLVLVGSYISRNSMLLRQITSQAKQTQQDVDGANTAYSLFSRLKGLLGGGKTPSGAYIPAVFAVNYYEGNWKLTARENLNQVKVNDSRTLTISLPSIAGSSMGDAARVLSGEKTFDQIDSKEFHLSTLRTNFDESGILAESIDFETIGGTAEKNLRGRIPLQHPAPYDIKLQVLKDGVWSYDLSSLQPGKNEFRVLASGIAFDGKALVNGMLVSEFGGFDADGKIRHKAYNHLAKDEEIGRFPYTFPANENVSADAATCSVTPLDMNFSINVEVNSPDRKVESRAILDTKVHVASKVAEPISNEVFMNSCTEQCRFRGQKDVYSVDAYRADLDATEFSKHKYGDVASAKERDIRRFAFHVAGRKLCQDFTPSAQAFKVAYGRLPNTSAEVVGEGREVLQDYISYTIPACKREFLFVRTNCGCFAAETRIRLGDGITEKAIDQLGADDRVWNPILQRSFAIRRMTRGPEPLPMIRIRAGGKTLEVTGKHPMMETQGLKPAFALHVGESIRIDKETWSRIEAIESVKSDDQPIVWNLELDVDDNDHDAHYVLANGITTGDLVLQRWLQGQN